MWSDIKTDKKSHRACSPKDSNRSGVPTDFSKPVIRLTDLKNRCLTSRWRKSFLNCSKQARRDFEERI